MQYAAILQLLAVVLPALLAFSTNLISGKKRFIIAIAAFFIIRKWASQAAIERASSGIENPSSGNSGSGSGNTYTNPNALATQYKQAMNPTNIEWLMDIDMTNLTLIYDLAHKTRGQYKAVFNSYQTQYKRNLTNDLIDELNATEYQKFLSILNA